eukprot:m.277551 g.277551  ORF g.277551 m.277551 type:complete len:88 (-) comp16149_c0_seq5:1469-1732(-)
MGSPTSLRTQGPTTSIASTNASPTFNSFFEMVKQSFTKAFHSSVHEKNLASNCCRRLLASFLETLCSSRSPVDTENQVSRASFRWKL